MLHHVLVPARHVVCVLLLLMPEGDHGLVVRAAQGARKHPGHLRAARLFPRRRPLHSARLRLLRVARVSLVRREKHGPVVGCAGWRMERESGCVVGALGLGSLHGSVMNLLPFGHMTLIDCGAWASIRIVDVSNSEATHGRHVVLQVSALASTILQFALRSQATCTGWSRATLDVTAGAMTRVSAITSAASLRQAVYVYLAVDLKVDATLFERLVLRHLNVLGRRSGRLVVARAGRVHPVSSVTPRRVSHIELWRRVVGTMRLLEAITMRLAGAARCL